MIGHSEILESCKEQNVFSTMLVQYSFQCSHVTFLWRCPNFLDQITILPKHASYLSLTLTSSIQQRSLLFSENFYALYFCYCRTFPSLLELGLWSGKLVLGQANIVHGILHSFAKRHIFIFYLCMYPRKFTCTLTYFLGRQNKKNMIPDHDFF